MFDKSISLILILTISIVNGKAGKNKEYYPEKWAELDYKPIVDNERLFKKYKECILETKPTSCPRDVTDIRSKPAEIFFYFLSFLLKMINFKF